ncbi:MAG: HAD family phosphatase [Firmicutes bacterium]|nr:HAD family phosphatase [Bacillota bacterium]
MGPDIKAVIFDMDGVIFDSERACFECWKEIASDYGLKDIEKVYPHCIGVTSESCKNTFLKFYGEDIPYDEMLEKRRALFFSRYDKGRLPVKPGVAELLSFLEENGMPAVIASSTRIAVVEREIEEAGLRQYFKDIIGGNMVSKSKPDPEIFLTAAKLLPGISLENIAIVEDSYNGIRAAFASGMYPVMVPDMIAPDEEMREKAALILPDLAAVKDWLAGLKSGLN